MDLPSCDFGTASTDSKKMAAKRREKTQKGTTNGWQNHSCSIDTNLTNSHEVENCNHIVETRY